MRNASFSINNLTSTIFFVVFVLAFFPTAFHHIIHLPLGILGLEHSAPSHTTISSQWAPKAAVATTTTMSWFQKSFNLPPKSRGSYLITSHVEQNLPELKNYKVGLLHLFVQHTSCALSLNENWDEDVREDMSDALDRLAPDDKTGDLYRHAAEGPDDMPAHIKSLLTGASISIPITQGRLATGTWQGIWYLEFRTSKHSRKVVATIQGEKA